MWPLRLKKDCLLSLSKQHYCIMDIGKLVAFKWLANTPLFVLWKANTDVTSEGDLLKHISDLSEKIVCITAICGLCSETGFSMVGTSYTLSRAVKILKTAPLACLVKQNASDTSLFAQEQVSYLSIFQGLASTYKIQDSRRSIFVCWLTCTKESNEFTLWPLVKK